LGIDFIVCFPKATENTLDLIAKVGTQVGNGLDVTVKYIDDKTGNVASAKWNKLDKATVVTLSNSF
jgi:hypothetical protein